MKQTKHQTKITAEYHEHFYEIHDKWYLKFYELTAVKVLSVAGSSSLFTSTDTVFAFHLIPLLC